MVSMRHAALSTTALALTTLGAAAWPFTIDDAFIVARYATRIAHGLGYTFESGRPSDGVTGPLWLVPLVAGVRAGIAPVSLGKWLSLVAGAVALLLVIARTKRVALGDRASWTAALVGASSFPLVVWSVAGLETGLAALAATALALAVTERPAPRGYLAGSCLAALAWLRPELLPFGGVLTLALALRDRRAGGRALALGGAGVGAAGGVSLRVVRSLVANDRQRQAAVVGQRCGVCVGRSCAVRARSCWPSCSQARSRLAVELLAYWCLRWFSTLPRSSWWVAIGCRAGGFLHL